MSGANIHAQHNSSVSSTREDWHDYLITVTETYIDASKKNYWLHVSVWQNHINSVKACNCNRIYSGLLMSLRFYSFCCGTNAHWVIFTALLQCVQNAWRQFLVENIARWTYTSLETSAGPEKDDNKWITLQCGTYWEHKSNHAMSHMLRFSRNPSFYIQSVGFFHFKQLWKTKNNVEVSR